MPGRAYLYKSSSLGFTSCTVFTSTNPDAVVDLYGRSVSSSGDITQDDNADIIIGAPQDDSERGRAFVFYDGNPFDAQILDG